MILEETISAILYFSNFALSATAIYLAVKLFRHYQNFGWLILACAFSEPFVLLLIRIIRGKRWFTYISYGPAGGIAQVTVKWEIPCFYFAIVVALVLLVRGARQGK